MTTTSFHGSRWARGWWRSAMLLLAIELVLVPGAEAKEKQDKLPPKITHEPIKQSAVGQAIEVHVDIVDPSGVFEPTLYYRTKGSGDFLRATLVKATKDYSATIPAAAVSMDLEYFVEAYDELGNGPTRLGSPTQPLRIGVGTATAVAPRPGAGTPAPGDPKPVGTSPQQPSGQGNALIPAGEAPVTAAASSEPGASSQSSPADDGSGNGLLIAGIAGGAALLVAAAVATGVVVWLVVSSSTTPSVGSVDLEVSAPSPTTTLWGGT